MIESWMPVNFIIRWIIHGICFIRIGSMNVFTLDHPNANTFHSPGINVSRIFNCHLCICSMQAPYMFVIQTLFVSDKYFPKGPIIGSRIFRLRLTATVIFWDIPVKKLSNFNIHKINSSKFNINSGNLGTMRSEFGFLCMCHSCFSYPLTLIMRFLSGLKSFLVAGTVPCYNIPKLVKIISTKFVAHLFFVPFQFGIGNYHT